MPWSGAPFEQIDDVLRRAGLTGFQKDSGDATDMRADIGTGLLIDDASVVRIDCGFTA